MPPKLINLGFKRSKTRIIRKMTTTSDKGKAAITVDPKDPKTRFYTKVEKNQFNLPSRITHMTPEMHKILKRNPEVVTFLENILIKKERSSNRLETENGIFILKQKTSNEGFTNNGIFELWYMDKKTTEQKTYFIKRYPYLSNWGNAEAEFLAVKEMERLGFNIIRPQFAITDIKNRTPNIIVYDYTNLMPYPKAVIARRINGTEILEIEEIFKKLKASKALKKLNDFHTLTKRTAPNNNVFVKRLLNGKLKLYFSDLYWEEEAYKQKREEYL